RASGGSGAYGRIILYLHRRLRLLVLVSANATTHDGLDRCATHRLGRGDSFCARAYRNVAPGLEFRSLSRAALALCRPTVSCCFRFSWMVFPPAFNHVTPGHLLAPRIRYDRLSARVLDITLFAALRFSSSCSR